MAVACVPVEQAHAKSLFEACDALADGRGRQSHLSARDEAARFCGLNKRTEGSEVVHRPRMRNSVPGSSERELIFPLPVTAYLLEERWAAEDTGMSSDRIGVGIVGTGGWAKYGHIAALKTLDEFKIVGIASRKQETAEAVAGQFEIPNAFNDERALISHPDADLVVILTPVLDHARLARIVIAAGKDVYSEWPLSTTTAESEELLGLAEAKVVRHIVGLQRRFGPSSRYLQDLIKQGYVGTIRSARMTVSVDAFGDTMPEIHAWSFDTANFANTLSVYGGHFGDVLFHAVGFPKQLTALVRNRFPVITAPESGKTFPTTRPDAAMAIGILENGALFSVQLEGGQNHRTGLQIDITGTEGILRVTNPRAFQNKDDNAIQGMRDDEDFLAPLPVPPEYQPLADAGLDVSQQDVAYLYRAYAR